MRLSSPVQGKKRKRMFVFILAKHFLDVERRIFPEKGEGSEVLQTCLIYPALPPTCWHPDLLHMVTPLRVPQTPFPPPHTPSPLRILVWKTLAQVSEFYDQEPV